MIQIVKTDDITQVVIPERCFNNHCLTTGPVEVAVGWRKFFIRVIAFNWAADPEVRFHGLN